MKILVTGALGQLGRTIQELSKNHPSLHFVFKDSEELDITNRENVAEILAIGNYDYVINCAAYTNVEQSEKTPELAFIVNAEAVKNIAFMCKKQNVILIHISTDYVFDGEKKSAYTADDIPNPINEYGKSKLLGEQYIDQILEKYYIVRTSWLYSKKYGKNFYRTILDKATKADELFITDEQLGCPTSADNLAKYLIDLILCDTKPFGIYHFTDGVPMTWCDFSKEIIKEAGLNVKVIPKKYKTVARRPKNSVLK